MQSQWDFKCKTSVLVLWQVAVASSCPTPRARVLRQFSLSTILPQADVPNTLAASVSIYGCNSFDLSGQYPGVDFIGMMSGTDAKSSIGAMDAAAAGEVRAR